MSLASAIAELMPGAHGRRLSPMTYVEEAAPATERLAAARERAYSMPLADFHPGNPELFRTDTIWPYFERLRDEAPVHYCTKSPVGEYWSVTKYHDKIGRASCRERV